MHRVPVCVLVADSNQSNRKHLTRHLADGGFCVIPAASGGDVLLQCEIDPPDVLVIDAALVDMDGYELCSRLRHDPRTADLPIIVTTEASDEMTRNYIGQMVEYAGGDFFLIKPYDANVLVQLVVDVAPSRRRPAYPRSHGPGGRPPSSGAPNTGPSFGTGHAPTRVVWPTIRVNTLASQS